MNRQKKASSIRKESEVRRWKPETSAEKEAVAAYKSKRRDTVAAERENKDWKKILAAKAASKLITAKVKEEQSKERKPWGESKEQELSRVLKMNPNSLLHKDLTALSPAEAKRYLLFVEPKRASRRGVLPEDSFESITSSQGCKLWDLAGESETEQQNRLFGVLKASEARSRIRALRLRYARMRAEEIKHLINRQKTARAAIRLEIFLPPHLNPTKIPDCLDRRERDRVEAILKEDNNYVLFR